MGQLEAATAVAGLSVEKGKAPSIKDRKELSAIQEVGKVKLVMMLWDVVGCHADHVYA